MNYEKYIGSKVKGFRFESIEGGINFNDKHMERYIGSLGTIIRYGANYDCFSIRFGDGEEWSYPAFETLRHIVSYDQVHNPQHYGGEDNTYEAIKVIEAWGLGFNLGNVVKYISRAGKKDEIVQDLEKARWYLDREINNLKK